MSPGISWCRMSIILVLAYLGVAGLTSAGDDAKVSESSISLADASHPVATRMRQFEDWKTFDGVKFLRRIVNFHHGRKVADIRVLELELNGALKLSDLAIRPKDLKPQMSRCGN
jgi:hypothetical protein